MIPSFSATELGNPNAVTSAYHSDLLRGWIQQSITVRGSDSSDGALTILAKLQSFLRLEENWDSYGAATPSKKAVHGAIDLVQQLDRAGQSVYFVAPGPNGEIVVELKNDERSMEIYFDEDGNSEYVIFERGKCVDEFSTVPSVYELIDQL